MTTLPNGVRIVSEKSAGATACMSVFVDAGSIYETNANTGITHLMEQMAWKTTIHRTHFRIVREAEAIGANVHCNASRELTSYTIDFVQSHLPAATELLADAVFNPRLQYWEVRDCAKQLLEEVPEQLKKNQMLAMNEALHAVAYQGALARPLVCPDWAHLNFEVARQWQEEHYTGKNTVVAVAGNYTHQEVVDLVQPLIGGLSPGEAPKRPPSTYVGGESRVNVGGSLTNLILAFEYKGGWKDLKNSVIASVVQSLMGGGGSFSAGGPGKGMHSRLFRRVLSKNAFVQHCVAYASIYGDTGLMGVHAACDASKADAMVGIMCDEMTELTRSVTEEEVARAKQSTISNVLMSLENKSVVVDDMGRQVMTFGHKKEIEEFFKVLRAVTVADVKQFVTTLLKSKPTLASMGDEALVPRLAQIEKRFAA